MKRGMVFSCLALLVTFAVAHAVDTKPVLKGPWLGTGKFTIHFAGMVSDAIEVIRRETGRQINISYGRGGEGDAGGGKAVLPITLDFDDATLDVILLSLCKQAGFVYQVQNGGSYIELREGDPTVDSRPAAEAGDYTIRVTGAQVQVSRSYTMGWGLALPDAPRVNEYLNLNVDISAKTPEAERFLAGIERKVTATTDKGTLLTPAMREGGPEMDGAFNPIQRNEGMGRGYGPAMYIQPLQLPVPPNGVRKLAKVEGTLRLFSQVKTTEVKLKPVAEGQTATTEDVTATLKSWKQEGDLCRATVDLNCPPLAKGPNRGYFQGDRRAVILVAKDGRRCGANSSGESGGNGVTTLTLQFNPRSNRGRGMVLDGPGMGPVPPPPPAAPGAAPAVPATPGAAAAPAFEPDYILITVTRYGDTDKTVPFVLENVPVP